MKLELCKQTELDPINGKTKTWFTVGGENAPRKFFHTEEDAANYLEQAALYYKEHGTFAPIITVLKTKEIDLTETGKNKEQ